MANTDIDLNRSERASLLLLAMGQERAASVLKHMGPKEVQLIGATMAGLRDITPEMVDVVLEELPTLD